MVQVRGMWVVGRGHVGVGQGCVVVCSRREVVEEEVCWQGPRGQVLPPGMHKAKESKARNPGEGRRGRAALIRPKGSPGIRRVSV